MTKFDVPNGKLFWMCIFLTCKFSSITSRRRFGSKCVVDWLIILEVHGSILWLDIPRISHLDNSGRTYSPHCME